jgi:hypothetical protein
VTQPATQNQGGLPPVKRQCCWVRLPATHAAVNSNFLTVDTSNCARYQVDFQSSRQAVHSTLYPIPGKLYTPPCTQFQASCTHRPVPNSRQAVHNTLYPIPIADQNIDQEIRPQNMRGRHPAVASSQRSRSRSRPVAI